MAWRFERSPRFERTFKRVHKKHKNECLNALDNLDTYHKALQEGAKPAQLSSLGFVHNEGEGAYAVDQRSGRDDDSRKVSAEIRLYFFPDDTEEALHVILIAGKDSQSRDVNEVHKFIRQIKAEREKTPKEETTENE
jgi:hypothetical protein